MSIRNILELDYELFKIITKYGIYDVSPELKKKYYKDATENLINEMISSSSQNTVIALWGDKRCVEEVLKILTLTNRNRISYIIDKDIDGLQEKKPYIYILPNQIQDKAINVIILLSWKYRKEIKLDLNYMWEMRDKITIIDFYDYMAQHGVYWEGEFYEQLIDYEFPASARTDAVYAEINYTFHSFENASLLPEKEFYLRRAIALCVYTGCFDQIERYIERYIEEKLPSWDRYVDFRIELRQWRQQVGYYPEKTGKSVIEDINNALFMFNCYGTKEEQEYENRWRKLKREYRNVKLICLRVGLIGEFYPLINQIMNEVKATESYCAFLPYCDRPRIANNYMLELMRRYFNIISQSEIPFWFYVIQKHRDEIDLSEWGKYRRRSTFPTIKVKEYERQFDFTYDEDEEGKRQALNMGIKPGQEYVCLANRSSSYNMKTVGTDVYHGRHGNAHRNFEFNVYDEVISYFNDKNIATVRMGREAEIVQLPIGCIDYASKYANDFMDHYLAANCKFMITGFNGIFSLPSIFSTPVLMINVAAVACGFAGFFYTCADMYIPKKYYDKRKKRFLSLREMMLVDNACVAWQERCEAGGIEFIDNTCEEVLEAAQEMESRLNGTWIDDEESLDYRNRYLEIYKTMKEIAPNNAFNFYGEPIPYRIASTYLKRNKYLLE